MRTIAMTLGIALCLVSTTTRAVDPDRIFVDGIEDCSMMSDPDGDRLYECDEVYAKTDPAVADTDQDGLSDGDEVLGTLDGLNLPAFGVKPLKKDLLIEYDWAEDANDCPAHSHALTPAQYESIRLVYANSPVTNPDGSTGINVIQDYGQGGLFTGGNLIALPDGHVEGGINAPVRLAVKAANFAANRGKYFHYATLVHSFGSATDTYSGVSDGHNDFIAASFCQSLVPLKSYKSRNTVLHELGHDLALSHGGALGNNCNYKPNYNSVMNYRYQFYGLDTSCKADSYAEPNRDAPESTGYSTGVRPPLNEFSLDERVGVCGHLPGSPPIDWDHDQTIEWNLEFDINSAMDTTPTIHQTLCGGIGVHSVLEDHDDWSAIDLTRVASDPSASGGKDDEPILCNAPGADL